MGKRHSFMTARFVPNEDSPDLYRNLTITFPGGSLTATRDVLESIFKKENLPSTCNPESKPVSRKSYSRTRFPGDDAPTIVPATVYEFKKYGSGSASNAAGGEPIKFLINGDFWTARLNGAHQDFMDYLCENTEALKYDATYWVSEKGRKYFVAHSQTNV